MKNRIPIRMIEWYQKKVSPKLNNTCRHTPTCSQYGKVCYERFNFFKATFLTAKRIITCNPLFKPKYDPVPLPKKWLKEPKHILITSFNAFNQDLDNISTLVLTQLDAQIGRYTIHFLVLDTTFKAYLSIIEQIQSLDFSYVIMLGQASSRTVITFEKQAKNIIDNPIKDNLGVSYQNQMIIDGHSPILTTSIHVDALVDTLKKQGYPVDISFDAGGFVCNQSYYQVLYYIQENHLKTNVLFIHLPKSYEQTNEVSSLTSKELSYAIHRTILLLEIK